MPKPKLPVRWDVDEFGRVHEVRDVADMFAPVECARCRHVYDSGPVEVIARYSDCSVWKCPGCHATVDDRPVGWGGGVYQLDHRGRRR